MEAVKIFDIEIDINDCAKLYDYGRGVYVTRPEDGWDHQAIAEACRQAVNAVDDETSHRMISRMDGMHIDKGVLEKDAGKQMAKDKERGFAFNNLDNDAVTSLPMRVLPVFKPGDIVKGQLILEATETIEAEEVKLKFKGMASTNLRYYNANGGYYDDRGCTEYVKEKVAVWRKEGSEDVDESALLSSSIKTGQSIPPGKYCYPFSFTLPESCVPSVPPMCKSCCGDWAFLAYYIKATIAKGKTLRRGNIVTNRGLWVEKTYDAARKPEFLTPLVEKQVQETGLISKGKITCIASLPVQSFVRGSQGHVPLKLEVDNQSGGPIDSVKACVMLQAYYRGKVGKWHGTRSSKFKSARVKEGSIGSGMNPQFAMKIPLAFKEDGVDGNLIPSGTLDECDLIDVRYEVCVVLKRKGLHRNMEMHIPIDIATENSKEALYPSLSGLKI